MLSTDNDQSQVHIIIVLVIKMLFIEEYFEIFLKNTDRRTAVITWIDDHRQLSNLIYNIGSNMISFSVPCCFEFCL